MKYIFDEKATQELKDYVENLDFNFVLKDQLESGFVKFECECKSFILNPKESNMCLVEQDGNIGIIGTYEGELIEKDAISFVQAIPDDIFVDVNTLEITSQKDFKIYK